MMTPAHASPRTSSHASSSAQDLLTFIEASPSAFHAVATGRQALSGQGFQELQETDVWKLRPGGKYFFTRRDSALLAFVVGTKAPAGSGFRLIGAHTDSPSFRVKPAPELIGEGVYLKLNTECYGGPILSTWMDRPLSLAGRVLLESRNPFRPTTRLVRFTRPLVIIPNLAIHMNREVNKGVELNKQTDMLPLLGLAGEKFERKGYLQKLLAQELGVKPAVILDADLFLHPLEPGCLLGVDQEFVSAPRLDDLAAVHAGLAALMQAGKSPATQVVACFDHEEVGSSTSQGADSQLLAHLLERIILAGGGTREDFFRSLAHSFLVSADAAHAVHPNKAEKSDPTSRPLLNRGPVIKLSANMNYTSDGQTMAVFEGICRTAKVPVQRFVNRSDERGGSTIGPLSARHLDIRAVDIGSPLLAMHSIRELGGARDHGWLITALTHFLGA